MKLNAEDRITKSIIRLQRTQPFFAFLLMSMKFEKEEGIPTIGVSYNGRCFYNPKFIESLSEDEVDGVLSHEVLHLGLIHLTRCGHREKEIFNVATDLAVNDLLITEDFKLPKCGLIPKEHKFKISNKEIIDIDKKTAEEIYDEIPKICQEGKGGSGEGQEDDEGEGESGNKSLKGFDEHEYGENLSEKEQKAIEKEWKTRLVEAGNYAKQRGNLPAGIERLIEKILPSKVNWRHILQKTITNMIPCDYTWARPSRKSISTGVYIPSVKREKVDAIIDIDTSGSIGQEELTEFLSEIVGIAKSFNNVSMTLIVHDCEIHNTYKVENGSIEEILKLQIKGGGGTSHVPTWEWLEKNMPMAKMVICLTDGFTDFGEKPRCEVLWVITKNGCPNDQIPFGQVVRLE